MNQAIRNGKWLQVQGKTKRAFGRAFGVDRWVTEGDALVVAGAIEESIGVTKARAVETVTRGVDQFAATTKRLARAL